MARKKRRPSGQKHPGGGISGQQRPQQKTRLKPDPWILSLAVLGMLLTGYLSLAGGSPAFCAEGGGCDVIQEIGRASCRERV